MDAAATSLARKVVDLVSAPRTIGRYALYDEIAHGGMATVHIGRLLGQAGFKRTVAIKRLHPQYSRDPEFVAMFLDEAHLAAKIRHPNVVPVLDVVAEGGELFVVMEYVHGESLSTLMRIARDKGEKPNPRLAAHIAVGMLHGLHAAHEAKSDGGRPLQIVHRDVSPQNVLVGADGVPRVLDFGVAKAAQRVLDTTKDGVLKGKISYMAPEQLSHASTIDRRCDIYAAGVILWEALTGTRMHETMEMGAVIARVFTQDPEAPSTVNPDVPPELDRIVGKALFRDRKERYGSAQEMAQALERAMPPMPVSEVSEWVQRLARDRLHARSDIISSSNEVHSVAPALARADSSTQVQEVLRSPSRNIPYLGSPQADENADTIPRASTERTSHVSSIEIAGAVPGVRPFPRGVLFVGIAAIVLVAGATIFIQKKGNAAVKEGPSVTSAAPTLQAPASIPPPSASAVPVDPTPVPTPEPSASTAVVAASRPRDTASAARSTTSANPKGDVHPRPGGTRPHPSTTAPAKCDPPWTVDATGVRVIKRECL